MIPTITSHLQSSYSITVFYALFLNCVSTNGGAIFSEFDAKHLVNYCEFYNCNAT